MVFDGLNVLRYLAILSQLHELEEIVTGMIVGFPARLSTYVRKSTRFTGTKEDNMTLFSSVFHLFITPFLCSIQSVIDRWSC